MRVPNDSLGLVNFERDVIKKSRWFVEEIEVLQKTVNKNKAA